MYPTRTQTVPQPVPRGTVQVLNFAGIIEVPSPQPQARTGLLLLVYKSQINKKGPPSPHKTRPAPARARPRPSHRQADEEVKVEEASESDESEARWAYFREGLGAALSLACDFDLRRLRIIQCRSQRGLCHSGSGPFVGAAIGRAVLMLPC